MFSFLSAFYENQRQLMQTPGVVAAGEPIRKAPLIVESALGAGPASAQRGGIEALLAAFRIPIAPTLIARSPMEPC